MKDEVGQQEIYKDYVITITKKRTFFSKNRSKYLIVAKNVKDEDDIMEMEATVEGLSSDYMIDYMKDHIDRFAHLNN